jgi:hypothetical protein
MTTVTPYLPKIGNITMNEHKRSGKPAFVLAYERVADGCPNCQGVGFVILVRADSGPYTKYVPSGRDENGNNRVVTWFDGDGNYRRGLYLKMDTLMYTCPESGGNLAPDYQDGASNNPVVKKLADMKRSPA